MKTNDFLYMIVCCLVVFFPVTYVYGQEEVAGRASLFSPTAILIHDETIRAELGVDNDQRRALDQLEERLTPLLFAMRDVPPDTTDSKAIEIAANITKNLQELDQILSRSQQRRLDQLGLQYKGFEALFYPRVQLRLGLTTEQMEQIRRIHEQSLTRQQKVMQQKSTDQDTSSTQQQVQKIVYQETQHILHVMSKDQHKQWQAMLGEKFDFSKLQPISFHAPEFQNVTAWINTQPLSMEDLCGRVVVVHFWTFGCSNCVQNYPIYQQWTRRYDSKEVLVLGIHTPEAEYEKSLRTLRQRVEQEGLSFAVAVDNDKTNWNAWTNRVWPSVYLVDKHGRVRYWWYGELRWQGAVGDQWMTQRIEALRAE